MLEVAGINIVCSVLRKNCDTVFNMTDRKSNPNVKLNLSTGSNCNLNTTPFCIRAMRNA